jgi:hypothetical protein
MKKLLGVVVVLLTSINSFAQSFSSIQGKVIDANTKEALQFVTIYFANSSIGTASQEDGSFKLENIPVGKYDLVASMIGYGRFSKSIEFTGNSIENFVIQLTPVATELESVTVSARKEKRSSAAYTKFERVFLGQSSNSFNCKILNRNDVYAFEKDQKVTASAIKPIVILNNALGYKIYYELKEFEADYVAQRLTILGLVRFEELTPANGKQKNKWTKERDRSYYGSDVHFLRSLLAHKLKENFYTIAGPDGRILKEEDIIKDGVIKFKGQLNITFSKENGERAPMQRTQLRTSGQQSQVVLNGVPVKVYENGYFEDFHNVVFLGQFQLGSVADQVPLGFTPSVPLK